LFSFAFVERLLIRILFTSIVLFLSIHLITDFKDNNSLVSLNPNNPIEGWTYDSKVLTFSLQEYALLPYVKIIVNGNIKGSFTGRYVTVSVREGDEVYIDGTYYNLPVPVELLNVSEGLTNPVAGTVYNLNGGIVSLGKVTAGKP